MEQDFEKNSIEINLSGRWLMSVLVPEIQDFQLKRSQLHRCGIAYKNIAPEWIFLVHFSPPDRSAGLEL